MAGQKRQQEQLWYGYLQAGEKSTPVVRDESLDTGDRNTVYLFNFQRRQILEYRREIVEPKLRELTPEEAGAIDDLGLAYTEVRRDFVPKGGEAAKVVQRAAASKARKEAVVEDVETEEVEYEGDEGWEEESD